MTIEVKKKTSVILKGVSGRANTGQMLALMGPSGCGKTSLLSVLSQRVPSNSVVSGEVLINGQPTNKSMKRRMGFVFQDDLLLHAMTVHETLLFSALLRLPEKVSKQEKLDKVDTIIEQLGLTKVKHSRIGREQQRGVSGGERKRVSIGVELISSPSILFLDEPTSGLDSSTALSIVSLLKNLAIDDNMIVISSIHQPRSNIFQLFDRLVLLKSGEIIFAGNTANVVPYFSSIGYDIPSMTNPADWLLDILTATNLDIPVFNSSKISQAPIEIPDDNDNNPILSHSPPSDVLEIENTDQNQSENYSLEKKWDTSFFFQFKVLLWRSSVQQRGEVFNGVNIFQIMTVSIIASIVWFQSNNIRDLTGVLFFILIQQSFNTMSTVTRIFPSERALMLRERSTGTYRASAYFLAKSCSDIWPTFVFPLLYATIVYWAVGLRPEASSFFIYLCIFETVIITAQSLGLLLSSVVSEIPVVNSISFVLILLLMLFGGFYVQNNRIPIFVRWIKYCSFLYWGYGALLVNEFSGKTFSCSMANTDAYGTSCPIQGDKVVASYGFNSIKIGYALLALWGISLLCRIGAYFALRNKYTIF